MASPRAPMNNAPSQLGNNLPPGMSDEFHFGFKVVVLGDVGVGKTTLLEGEGGARDNPITSSKIGVNFFRKYYAYQEQTYRIEYWDCPGATRYVSLARHFSAGAAAALILFDKNNRASFDSVSRTWLRAIESSCTSVIPILVGTTTGYNASKKGGGRGGGRGGKQNNGGIMGLEDDYTAQFGFGGGNGGEGGGENGYNDGANESVSDEEARQFAKRHGLEYVNADPLARGEPDFATPSGVFEFVFSSIVGSLPRLAEPSLLLQRGVKLGSLLLGDREYQQKLYSSSNRARAKLPVTSSRRSGKQSNNAPQQKSARKQPGNSRNNSNNQNSNSNSKQQNQNVSLGDEHLDQEGKVQDRTDRQIREMETDVPPPSGSASGAASAPAGVVGYLSKSKTQVVTHYMQSKSWHSTARRSRPNAAGDRSREPIGHCLSLEHVHGFRGQDTRNNLHYAKDGTVIYIAAALAIAVDAKSGRQRYMGAHTDDIISIALSHHTKKRGSFSLVATGEVGRTPKIIIWESNSMRVINTLRGAHSRGVVQLAFSPDGTNLASIGLDDANSLAIHDWRSGVVLVRVRTGGAKVYGLAFQPGPATNPTDDSSLVTCGAKHLTFWKRSGKSQISSRSGRFGRELAGDMSIVDICFDAVGRTYGASSLGHLCVWAPKENNNHTAMLPLGKGSIANAHKGPINSVETIPGGEKILSGGVDGVIHVWSCHSNVERKVELFKTFTSFNKLTRVPSVQSLSVSSNKARALIGTRGGDIVEIKLNDGTLLKNKPLMTGHNKGELWGLAAHPVDATVFVTGGDDKTVRLWSIRKKECVAITTSDALLDMCRALVFTPRKGNFVVCGLGGRSTGKGGNGKHAGKITVLDTKTLKAQATFKVAKEMISDLCFTPDGTTLAVASHDNIIYLLSYRGPTDLQPRARCRGHSSYVSNISINDEGKWMMSNDGAGEIMYWDIQTGDQETRIDKVKSARWFPNTCPMSWSTQGIWPKEGDLTDVNACMQRGVGASGMEGPAGYGMVVTADDFGKVKLFNSPSLQWCAPHMVHRGHSSHVTNVCFNADGTRVISVGGNDRCAFVWRVIQVNEGANGGSFGLEGKE